MGFNSGFKGLSNRDREMISIAALRRLFPQWVISRFGDVPWPPRSPDLTASDFFFFCGII